MTRRAKSHHTTHEPQIGADLQDHQLEENEQPISLAPMAKISKIKEVEATRFRNAGPSRVFRLVVSELERFRLDIRERRTADWSREDRLSALTSPSGRRYTIGRQAERILSDFARREIEKHQELFGKIDVSDLVAEMKSEIGREIDSPTSRSPATIVKVCTDRLSAKYAHSLTYYIPCVMPQHSMITRFNIGPITFRRKERVWSELEFNFVSREAEWFSRYKDETRLYNWVALVTVFGFNKRLGRARSYLFTEIAISAIKMLYPSHDAIWFGTDAQLIPLTLRHGISQRGNSKPSIEWRKTFPALVGDEASEHLLSGQRNDFLWLVGEFIRQHIHRGKFGFIGNKIVSALKWADIAGTQTLPSQRIIAYSNCLESLFVTNDTQKRLQISDRSAPFLNLVDHQRDWVDEISRFYKARSDLVHGDTSPVSDENIRFAELGKELCDNSIMGMMYFFNWLLSKYPIKDTPEHLRPYNGNSSLSKAFATELPLYIDELRRHQ